jgi:hypothetical protein
MTPETQGRFCASCQKCVVDLSNKRPSEIKALYDAHNGDMCARIPVRQLAREPRTTFRPALVALQGLRRLQRFALALLFAGGLMFGLPSATHAQGQVHEKMGKIAPMPSNSVSGKVRWENHKVAEGVKVSLTDDEGNTLATTTTDADGNYAFQGRWYGQVVVMAIHGEHFGQAHLYFGHGAKIVRNIQLEREQMLMGDIQMVLEPDLPDYNEVDMPATIDLTEPLLIDEPNSAEAEGQDMSQSAFTASGEKIDLEMEGFQCTVYPNPANDKVFMAAKSFPDHTLTILVTDMEGRKLSEQTWRPHVMPVQVIPITDLASGTYLLTLLQADGKHSSTRFVKH